VNRWISVIVVVVVGCVMLIATALTLDTSEGRVGLIDEGQHSDPFPTVQPPDQPTLPRLSGEDKV